jgi:biotin synthase-related radical SAM superfamily protein
MRSLALFAPTFSRVQEMLQSIQRIKNNTFKTTFKRIPLCILPSHSEMASRAFLVANSIERNVTEIQSPVVE